MKKLCSILVSLCMLMALLPMTVTAEETASKITPLLQEQMDNSGAEDVISTYVWYEEITDEDIKKETEALLPLVADAYWNDQAFPYDDLREILENDGFPEFALTFEENMESIFSGYRDITKSDSLVEGGLEMVINYYLPSVTYRARTDALIAAFGIEEEQVFSRYDWKPVMILNIPASKIQEIAQNDKIVKLDWFSYDIFDFFSYLNQDHPNLTGVSCMCVASGFGENAYPGINCYHYFSHYGDLYLTMFRWHGDQDRMIDFENDIATLPDCFDTGTTNAFLNGKVLFLDGVPNLGDYLMFFERRIKEVYIPNTVKKIGEHTFSRFADVSIFCYSGSYAEEYAKTHNIECHLLDTDEVIPAAMSGDASGDGVRNLKDVLALRKALADGTESALSAGADCNVDGEVNMKDVLMLRQHLAGLFV